MFIIKHLIDLVFKKKNTWNQECKSIVLIP